MSRITDIYNEGYSLFFISSEKARKNTKSLLPHPCILWGKRFRPDKALVGNI